MFADGAQSSNNAHTYAVNAHTYASAEIDMLQMHSFQDLVCIPINRDSHGFSMFLHMGWFHSPMDFHPPKHISHNPVSNNCRTVGCCWGVGNADILPPNTIYVGYNERRDRRLTGARVQWWKHMTTHRPTTMYWFGMEGGPFRVANCYVTYPDSWIGS